MAKTNLAFAPIGRQAVNNNKDEIYGGPHIIERIKEIINLHDEINLQATSMLPKIIRIGELLVIQKQTIPHGQFTHHRQRLRCRL